MKLYIKQLTVGALVIAAASMTSCTDLDTPIDNKYTTLPNNPIIYESEFNGCYGFLHGWFGRDFNEGVVNQGDEIMGICFGRSNYYDDGRSINGSIHCLTPENWNTKIIDGCMNGCTQTNKVIASYGGAELRDPLVAPVRAMRAYYHFWMMELYGDCPILNRRMEEGERIDRQPRAEVAKFIESELLEILSQEGGLSKANDLTTYGKPNYWMAAALLVKLYLNWGVYTHDITTVDNNTPNEKLNDCVKWCDEIIQSGLFEVGKGYRKKFFPNNGSQIKDFIYALDVDPDGKLDGSTTWHRWMGFKKESNCQPYPYTWLSAKSIGGNAAMTPEAVKRFNLPGDERNEMIIAGPVYRWDRDYNVTNEPVMLYGATDFNQSSLIGQLNLIADFEFDDGSILSVGDANSPAATPENIANGTAFENVRKGARCWKYPPREEDYKLWNRQQANDTPIFRYADILLTKAECILRGATATLGATPVSLVNEVRDCASAPHCSTMNFDELLDERSRELIMEPWRRNDLIRFGRFEDDWGAKNRYKVWDNAEHTQFHWVERVGAKDKNRRLMPIHREVLERNTNWKQNPSY